MLNLSQKGPRSAEGRKSESGLALPTETTHHERDTSIMAALQRSRRYWGTLDDTTSKQAYVHSRGRLKDGIES